DTAPANYPSAGRVALTAHRKEHSHDGAAFRIESIAARHLLSGIRLVSAPTRFCDSTTTQFGLAEFDPECEPGAANGPTLVVTGGLRVRWCGAGSWGACFHRSEHRTTHVWRWRSSSRHSGDRNRPPTADTGRDATRAADGADQRHGDRGIHLRCARVPPSVE